ncbi:MAG TPA: NAD(P)/FAD-dependent oxidoreductase [Xanthobacteraceae bacterium]|jgi:NADH dehydrogenase|nr:NAD(P)/FAD-dependent oxidoreductase [Xanthobacteraceae bacterium]
MTETRPTPRIVIVGAGFGGLSAAKALARAPAQVVVIDERNYHLFQPLLYQVATAGLSPADIAAPIRGIVRRQKNTHVMLGSVTGIDVAGRAVLLGQRRVPYDYLIVATGARHAYFGHEEWAAVAPGLKKIDDATRVRRKILIALERAEDEEDAAERRRLMTFVVVGAGPTGVEMAGSIAELAKVALAMDFRAIDPRKSRIVLIEAGPRVLPAFPEPLSAVAQRRLQRLGVEVRLGTPVTGCDAAGVTVGSERIECRTIIWAAGVAASPAAEWLGAAHDHLGRVNVERDLSLPGHDDIFVIGDTARLDDATGKPLPGLAPVAKQQGKYVARLIAARLAGRPPPGAFRYRHAGNLATIGRTAAVVDFGFLRLTGFVAWVVWSLAHIYFLIGFRNRLAVALEWLWAYLTFQSGARLITEVEMDEAGAADNRRSG